MTNPQWAYPSELLLALGTFGLAPRPHTPPTLVRDALSALYRWEIRKLRDRRVGDEFPKKEYSGRVIELRKRYWPLALTPEGWDKICEGSGVAETMGSEVPRFRGSEVPRGSEVHTGSEVPGSAHAGLESQEPENQSREAENQNPGTPEPRNPRTSASNRPPVRLALIQQHASPNHGLNVHRAIHEVRRAAREGARLIAFAELAFTKFFPQQPPTVDVRTLAETVPGPTTQVFSGLAKELGVVIVLNVFERDGDKTYDCSPVIDADGRLLGRTRMVHITEYPCVHEQQYYQPGDLGAPVFDTRVGRVGVAICYDRHFPEYMRALALGGADIVVVPQAGVVDEWAPGVYEGELQVAAFQNGYFVALCNRVGAEECVTFAGESFVVDPHGRVIARAPRGEDAVLMADLALSEVGRSHARTLLLKDRRPELYAEWIERR